MNPDTEQVELRPEVAEFAQMMERRLLELDGERSGWKDMKPDAANTFLKAKLTKLVKLGQQLETEAVIDCTVNIANWCMILTDVCGGIRTQT